VWEPTESDEVDVAAVAVLAVAPVSATGEPKFEPSTMNCTEPVGTPEPEVRVTVAVKVTDWPNTDGFAEDTTEVVVVAAAVTVTVG
jgi:hypothetical protein